jgi:hypothetical protein
VIIGKLSGAHNSIDSYSVALHVGSMYTWVITGGTLLQGEGTNQITVRWDNSGANGTVKVTETNDQVCMSDPQTVTVNLTNTGIAETNADDQLLVYPSPTQGRVKLESLSSSNEITTVELFDLLGKMIYTGMWNNMQDHLVELDLSGNPPGMYLVKITNTKGCSLKKIMLTR